MASERIRRIFRPLTKLIFVILIFVGLIVQVTILLVPDKLVDTLNDWNRLIEGLPLFRGLFADWHTTIIVLALASIFVLEGLNVLLVNNKIGILEDQLIEEYTKIDVNKRSNLVLIPAYNEEETIVKAIKIAQNAGRVLVIDDGSEDNTQSYAREHSDHVISHTKNHGLAQGIMNGIDFALKQGYKSMVIFDADLQYTQRDLENVVKVLQNSKFDIVMGSRLQGSIEKMKITKRFGNWIFSKTLSYITEIPISDGQTGLRAFTDVFASNVSFRGQFTYTQEMIFETAKNDFSIAEIPIDFKVRQSGESRLMAGALDYAIRAWNLNLQIIAEFNPLKYALTMVGGLIILSTLLTSRILRSGSAEISFNLQSIAVMIFISVYVIVFTLGTYASIIINRLQLINSTKNYKVLK